MAKSSRPIIRIHDLATDEVIDREMNDQEFAQHQAHLENEAAIKAEAETKAVEKQALLDRLGITADEAKLLLG
jgi:hypothetical protein